MFLLQTDSYKRMPDLIRNGVPTIIQEKKCSFFIDVNMNLHYILRSADPMQNKSVLWAYKKDFLGFSIKPGVLDDNTEDPFELFISLTNIQYYYYKETEKILGNTYGMCTLQDFEAMNPNLLVRTIETVEGGRLVILLFKTMTSLQQLYTMTMDIYSRYRTEAYGEVIAGCLVVDDKLNVFLILDARGNTALPLVSWEEGMTEQKQELLGLKESRAEGQPVSSLVDISKTVDQAKVIMTFADTMAEKTLGSIVTLRAGQGRGKSAAPGVAIAAAIAHGPENLKILFDDHLNYDIIQSKSPAFNQAIVRVKAPHQHWQTIQYNQPQDAHILGQAELVVIDEAAAISLLLGKKVMGPYLRFMASTIMGYKGTAPQDGETVDRFGKTSKESDAARYRGRSSREAGHSEPIHYTPNDPIEKWLNNFLCLDAILASNRSTIHRTNFPNDLQLMSDAPSQQLLVLLPSVQEGTKKIPDPLCMIQVSLEGLIAQESVQNGGDMIPWLVSLQTDNIQICSRESIHLLLLRILEKRLDTQDYIGLSYSLIDKLPKIWKKKQKFALVYFQQIATELVGEYSRKMIKTIANFHKCFFTLDPYEFRIFLVVLALIIFESENAGAGIRPVGLQAIRLLRKILEDIERHWKTLEDIGKHWKTLEDIGRHWKILEDIEKELNLPPVQVLTMFWKSIQKVTKCFWYLSQVISKTLPKEVGKSKQKMFNSSDNNNEMKIQDFCHDLQEGREQVIASMNVERQIKSITSKHSYSKSTIVSVKIKSYEKRKAGKTATEIYKQELGKVYKRGKMSNSRE
ncbi:DUF699-domain-containing protein [Choiromyces venosus 120613-1]|uniref:DUF699-domain-containing protein n=1 Tax=Choiromyces venosus 120613-1 TaxID=1336337 RepID=A0A3N4JWE6_9PEZI|nr:DUF699-domain-containing protein [Choiromyces venosus 120613-1]